VQITNDAWFGTRSGPAQHLAQARARAIETGLPVIRVANTGISAVISPDGAVIHSIGLNDMGWADVATPAKLQTTPYLRHGDLAFWILAIIATSLGVIARRKDNLLTI
jgi:apolipoprotein N-acyltransferase